MLLPAPGPPRFNVSLDGRPQCDLLVVTRPSSTLVLTRAGPDESAPSNRLSLNFSKIL